MTHDLENAIRRARQNIQEAVDILRNVQGENEEVDEAADSLGHLIADLEFVLNGDY